MTHLLFLNRRRYYLFPCLSSGLFVAVSLAGQTNVAPDKPNILVFVADDAGMDFGCYGNSVIKTPNIDRLASQGLRFQNTFLTAPQSSPSRTSMMTGMFAHTIGTEDLHTPIDDQTRIMPAYFKEGGYHTGTMLKKHWGENGDKQFDSVITDLSSPYELDLTEEKYNEYTKFLDQATGHPFFLWVGSNDPHRPYDREVCPQENDPSLIPVPLYLVDGPDTRRDLADYYDEITRMDKNIGRMVGELEKED